MTSSIHPDSLQTFQLDNGNGMQCRILNYGAILQSITLQTPGGILNPVLGFPKPAEYLKDDACHGAIVGRYCNRIGHGEFALNGQIYRLPKNNGNHHLHGGPQGFNRRLWQLVEEESAIRGPFLEEITLSYLSVEGEAGYPGNLEAKVRYQLFADQCLQIDLTATTDAATPINLTGHAYFNLNHNLKSAENHQVKINAERYLPAGKDCLPTGEIREVAGSDFDFRQMTSIGPRIHSQDPGIMNQKGLDHNFIASGPVAEAKLVGELYSPESGVTLKVSSNQPGVQLYTGNHLGKPFTPYQGICLEPQNFPDAPNQKHFPNAILKPGEIYHHKIRYQFCW